MQDREGQRVFLADFGLAKSVATGGRLTRTGQALGTPAYMSPEQARGEVSGLAPSTDVWSLGCVLYAMLAGRSPFDAVTPEGVMARILTVPPSRLRALRPDVPRPLERVVAAALAKAAGSRYPDGRALREDLDRLLRGEPPRAPRPGRVRRSAVLLGAAAAVAAGAAALAAGTGRPAGPGSPVPRHRVDEGWRDGDPRDDDVGRPTVDGADAVVIAIGDEEVSARVES